MLKVLMSAYACEPGKGSEPGAGWNWAVQAARFHEVWVMTRANNRPAIEAELACRPVPNLHVTYHDLPRWARLWKRGARGVYLYYLLWQLTAVPVARNLSATVRFDLGHHVTFASCRFPSLLAYLDLPYLWGPIGGGERPPVAFYLTFGLVGALKQAFRDVSNLLVRANPLVRRTARRASAILVTTPATAGVLPTWARGKAKVMPVIGLDAPIRGGPATPGRPDEIREIRLLYVGRLVYWKGLQLALEAFARARHSLPHLTLTVAGDGPFAGALRRLAHRLGVAEAVRFTGELPRADILGLYESRDIFLFPSLQDSGGFVVLEAMAAGLPVICLDIGGPALAVTDDTGLRVAAVNPRQVAGDLAIAIERLALDPELRRAMGEAGRRRVADHYLWERTGCNLRSLYERVATAAARPEDRG